MASQGLFLDPHTEDGSGLHGSLPFHKPTESFRAAVSVAGTPFLSSKELQAEGSPSPCNRQKHSSASVSFPVPGMAPWLCCHQDGLECTSF